MEPCEGCSVTVSDFGVLTLNKGKLLDFYVSHGVLKVSETPKKVKHKCQKACTTRDGKKSTKCIKGSAVSARDGSWFSSSGHSIAKISRLVYLWLVVRPPRAAFIKHDVGLPLGTVAVWHRRCSEVCDYWVRHKTERLGGQGRTVEVERCNVGVDGSEVKWVLGGCDRETGSFFVALLRRKTPRYFLTIIKKWILPNTTIVSSCLEALNTLEAEGYHHDAMERRVLIDAKSGRHTQRVRRMWRELRANLPRMTLSSTKLEAYLSEFMFKRKYQDHRQRAHAFFTLVGEMNPPV